MALRQRTGRLCIAVLVTLICLGSGTAWSQQAPDSGTKYRYGTAAKGNLGVKVGKRVKSGNRVMPRIGREVVIESERGDPDRPIVIGPVYNQHSMPAYRASGYGVRNAPPYMVPQ